MNSKTISLESIDDLYRQRLSGLYQPTESSQFIRLLCDYHFGWNAVKMRMEWSNPLDEQGTRIFFYALDRLLSGTPIQYIICTAYFGDLALNVCPGIFIPRPETFELCNLIMTEIKHMRYKDFNILDVGTGSGCIAISLKQFFRKARITAVDISQKALDITAFNANRYHCPLDLQRIDILNKNQTDSLNGFHCIVSNPPYITFGDREKLHANIRNFEPEEALFVPDNDPYLFYRAIAVFAQDALLKPGILFFEIPETAGASIRETLQFLGYQSVVVFKDSYGKDRFIRADWQTDIHNNPLS